MNGRVREDLLHAVAGRAERIDDLVHCVAIGHVLRLTQANGLEDLFDLALGEGIRVAELLAQALGTGALAGQAGVEAEIRVLTFTPVVLPVVIRRPEALRDRARL